MGVELVETLDVEPHVGVAHVIQRKSLVKQAYEGTDGAGGVVVLGFGQQQSTTPFEVAQVHIVAEGGTDDVAATIDGEHDLGLGIVPMRLGMQADLGAAADSR